MSHYVGFAQRVQEWTREAVEQWGDDWPRIAQHLQSKMEKLDPDERSRLAAEIDLTLKAAAPTTARAGRPN